MVAEKNAMKNILGRTDRRTDGRTEGWTEVKQGSGGIISIQQSQNAFVRNGDLTKHYLIFFTSQNQSLYQREIILWCNIYIYVLYKIWIQTRSSLWWSSLSNLSLESSNASMYDFISSLQTSMAVSICLICDVASVCCTSSWDKVSRFCFDLMFNSFLKKSWKINKKWKSKSMIFSV